MKRNYFVIAYLSGVAEPERYEGLSYKEGLSICRQAAFEPDRAERVVLVCEAPYRIVGEWEWRRNPPARWDWNTVPTRPDARWMRIQRARA